MDFFAIGTKTIDTVRKSPLFATVLGSGSTAIANVYEVSEPRAESWIVTAAVAVAAVIRLTRASTKAQWKRLFTSKVFKVGDIW